ncbi:hypothetical protein MUG94_07455 [Arthrobacter gengyunqii]|uniref:hypothetical protein n=1 Tax=Arthrobacter gengyunqii TaxID=2886940 RepID=UPI001D13F052|nr:hypothetical protein [Arthrobacter gengyunqii]UOY97561.1 hypothetical protein MUG94_07455 [Arthrobacter gengyunqii]
MKENISSPGPFEADFSFGSGVTALVTESNLKGKSTVLELITWALRGSPRRLRTDVKPWLRNVTVEYDLNSVPMAVKLESKDGRTFAATVISGGSNEEIEESLVQGQMIGGCRLLARDLNEVDFAEFQSALMLDRFGLQPITNWQKFPKSSEGRPQVHKWPTYFGAIYLPDAGSDVLLGDIAMAGLPARILQLFCDVPLLSDEIRTKVLLNQISQDERNTSRRETEDAEVLVSRLADLQSQKAAYQASLDSIDKEASSGRSIAAIEGELRTAERRYVAAAAGARELNQILAEARADRQAEQRRSTDILESEIAALLFQGLSPKHCPRCEGSIDSRRIAIEQDEHKCAVCTSALPLSEDHPAIDAEDEVEATVEDADGGDEAVTALDALLTAEVAAEAAAAEASSVLQEVEDLLTRLTAEFAHASQSRTTAKRRDTELALARIEGAISSIPSGKDSSTRTSDTTSVLKATVKVLEDGTREAANAMFVELNEEVAKLGRSFGIKNLDSVELNRSGGLKVTTAGVPDTFGNTSGGERVRLRVALLVALLRIGAIRGNGTHPGLILLDSPGSHELKTEDERTLLRELNRLQRELPGLQVIITTAKPDAVRDAVAEDQIYLATGDGTLW